ncbi:hypothetical protein FOCG_10750 [Fusarium oxysporum f. sp. radicis-lycopersici 26381]|uniref:Uncharacterized protein n=1 Tax=Fusarium oxysporum Fo47 TaxID=660027 RepID=W9JZG7_FUSOX|nr:hypothetical protein FOZG_12521 [Fusarium oxysporum Fo47]EWZ95315.1 hypothetical protein FOWG_05262 [Fusarium oxysporum f. sp. lycopersici MN25]EXL48304.1 hypothetical protein FOCG_10750 [Fusarium oxysporum f. sp. radicis-lycopersici 26381]EWZ34588.1 hypothetical protein FOZG_12521 [Fusarium oxysporum Fo47]EWZ95316.1 hypothetical protein FOWG_05262 [Fusarium oxysporum f. sp. lycopersici MN25]
MITDGPLSNSLSTVYSISLGDLSAAPDGFAKLPIGLIDSLQLLARPAPYTSRRQDSRGGSANSFMTELAHDTWTRCHGAACRRQQSRSTTAMSSSCCRHNWIVSMGFGGWNSVFLRIRS